MHGLIYLLRWDFDSINKPIWAHLMLETADNAPKVALGMFLKYFYTFRHVMVTNVDLVLNRARQAFGGTFDERWTIQIIQTSLINSTLVASYTT